MAGLFPMVATFQGAFGIDQDVGYVLDVADLVGAAPDLEQRIVSGRAGVGRIEKKGMGKALAPARRQLPIFAVDIVDDGQS